MIREFLEEAALVDHALIVVLEARLDLRMFRF
jgi:hypothetical protein